MKRLVMFKSRSARKAYLARVRRVPRNRPRNGLLAGWWPWVVLVFCWLVAWAARADVCFKNDWSNSVSVTGSVQMEVAPGSSFSFVPSSLATNGFTVGVGGVNTAFSLSDGSLYVVGGDGVVLQEAVLRSAADDDGVLEQYFMQGLELGTGSAAVLFGIMAIRKAVKLGDFME